MTNKISPFPYVESGIKVEQVAYLGTPNNVDSITVNYTSWGAGQRKGGEFHIEEIGL